PAVPTRSPRRGSRSWRRPSPRLEALEVRELLAGSITGVAFSDLNQNGVQDAGEPALAGVPVALDLNNDGIRDSLTTTFSSTGAETLRAGTAHQSTLHLNLRPGELVSNVAVQIQVTIADPRLLLPPPNGPSMRYEDVSLSHYSNGATTAPTLAAYMSGNLNLTFDDASPANRHDLRLRDQESGSALPPDGS